jgi:hypothetical protein
MMESPNRIASNRCQGVVLSRTTLVHCHSFGPGPTIFLPTGTNLPFCNTASWPETPKPKKECAEEYW